MPDTNEDTQDKAVDLVKRSLELLDRFASLFVGQWRQLWPDWRCTQSVTQKTRPSRKPKKLRGNLVTPQERYQFHTPFHTYTDGKQWAVQCDSKYISHRAIAFIGVFFSAIWIVPAIFLYQYDGLTFFFYLSLVSSLVTIYYIYKSRTGGEDTWVVFDRTTGNVCFWKRDAEHSLTVPLEKVNCYWIEVFRRGVSHSLYFMPTENLPNERHRWWQVMFGTATTYDQAQYFWRVLTDFMDPSKPIPSVPGLSHQLYFVEKHGYTIEDLTEGNKEITFEEFEEAEAAFKRETMELRDQIRQMLEPEHFNTEKIINFYENAPLYAQQRLLFAATSKLSMFVQGLEDDSPFMYPGFKEFFSFDEYKARVAKLTDYFFELNKAQCEALGIEEP